VKTKTSNGVEITVSTTSNADGSINGVFEESAKYEPYGLSFKGTVESPRKFKGEVALTDKLLKNLKAVVNAEVGGSSESFKVSFEYKASQFTLNGGLDVLNKDTPLTAAAVFGFDRFILGADVQFNAASSDLKKVNLALGYTGSDFASVVRLNSFFTSLVGAYQHQINSNLDIGGELSVDLNKSLDSPKLTLVASYALDKDAVVKSKLDTDGKLSLSYSQKLNSSVKLILGTTLNTSSLSSNSHKYGFQLNFTN
jgi:voltage-dependent anion channel protein 2